jgi:hypothetical protein
MAMPMMTTLRGDTETGRGRGRITGGDGGGPTSRWLRNKGCVLCRHDAAAEVIHETRWAWGKLSLLPPAQVRGDIPCAGGACGDAYGWEGRAVYCSKDCRLRR